MSNIIVKPGQRYRTKNGQVIKIQEESQKLFVGFPEDSGPEADSMQFFADGNHILDPELQLVEELPKNNFKKRNKS